MGVHGRVLVAKFVFDADHDDEEICLLDLQMLVNFKGKERTTAEFRALCRRI